MNLYPTQLERSGERELIITWSDGERRRYTSRGLRDACPCATCREKGTPQELPGMLPILGQPDAASLVIVGMKPVGNYAYAISFSDGHDTGIFSFELLRELGS